MIRSAFRRSHRLSADQPPHPSDQDALEDALAALVDRDLSIAAYEKAVKDGLDRERKLQAAATDLQFRNEQLAQRLDVARSLARAAGPTATAGTPRSPSDAALIARQQENLNSQANIIADQQAALAGRAPVRLGGWR